jgi:hypothetical protein
MVAREVVIEQERKCTAEKLFVVEVIGKVAGDDQSFEGVTAGLTG